MNRKHNNRNKHILVINICTIILSVCIMYSCKTEDETLISGNPMEMPETAGDTWTAGNDYSLVWSDEFSGPDIDTSIWSYETYETGWRHEWNNEWQDYVDNGKGGENAFIQDGVLVIKASLKSDRHEIHAYDSIRMVTKSTRSWKYGKIAARMALPYGQGIWPAFWMLGNEGEWPAGGEIDILELIGGDGTGIGNDNVAHGALHWSNTAGTHDSTSSEFTIETLREFHVFELEWTPSVIRIGVDGTYYLEADITDPAMSEFHQPFYILLNLAIGGNWAGYPDANTVFPQYMYVDWIRVYQ